MKEFKQKLYEWSIILMVACVSVYLVVNVTLKNTDIKTSEQIKKSADNIEKINGAIDSQNQKILTIKEQLMFLDSGQAVYVQAIKENTKWQQINYSQLEQIKLLYNEKINTAGNYNYGQIDSFFSAKYNQQGNR
jgi:hypothetical protein